MTSKLKVSLHYEFLYLDGILNSTSLIEIDALDFIQVEWQGSPTVVLVNISRIPGNITQLTVLTKLTDEKVAQLQVKCIVNESIVTCLTWCYRLVSFLRQMHYTKS